MTEQRKQSLFRYNEGMSLHKDKEKQLNKASFRILTQN